MIVDGKAIAKSILAETAETVAPLGYAPTVLAIAVAPDAATESYLRIKTARAADAGMTLVIERFPDTATEEDLIARIETAAEDAAIVQLPLPAHLDAARVVDAIPLAKDADVLSKSAYERFAYGEDGALVPPVARAVEEILSRSGVSFADKKVVIAGQGKLVGKPVAAWFKHHGVEPVTIDRSSGSLDALRDADIVVSGMGKARIITPAFVKPGAVLIDAGTSESEGDVVGDMDPACAESASLFTPVPGGVGPVAVACLFASVAALVRSARSGTGF